MVKKYKMRPISLQAIQWTCENNVDVLKFGENKIGLIAVDTYSALCIATDEGDVYASVGDYIVRGVQGEFYAYKPDVFEQMFEEVDR